MVLFNERRLLGFWTKGGEEEEEREGEGEREQQSLFAALWHRETTFPSHTHTQCMQSHVYVQTHWYTLVDDWFDQICYWLLLTV